MATHSSILAKKTPWTEVPGLPWWLRSKNNLPAMQETWVQSLGQEETMNEVMTTHSSTLA